MILSPTAVSALPVSQQASPFLSPSHVTRLSLSSQSSSPAAAQSSSSSSQPHRITSQQYTPTPSALSSASLPLSVGSEEEALRAEYNRKHNEFFDRIRDATMTIHKLKALITEAIARQSDEQLRLIISAAFASHHLVTIKSSQQIVRPATPNAATSTPRSSPESSQRLSATQVLDQGAVVAPVQVEDNDESMMAKRSTIVRIMMNTILNTETILASAVETTFFDVMINHKVHCATKQYSQLIARIIQSLPNIKHRQIGVIDLLPSTLHRLRQIYAAGEEIDMTGIGESEGALTYTEFEDWYILHMTRQSLRWSRDSLLPLILTIDKSSLTRDHLHALLNKLFVELPVAVTDDLPNIIYNILLVKQADSAILLSSIIHFIHSLDQHYGVHDQSADMIKQSHSTTNNTVPIQLSQSLSQAPSSVLHQRGRQQLLINESTILLYFHFVFSQDSALGTDFLTLITSHTIDLTPYIIAILLSMARIQRFQDKIINIINNILSDELHYQYKLNHSLYISRTLHDSLPLFSSVITILQAAIIHCISVFDQSTLHSTVLLGFKLLDTKLPTTSSTSSATTSSATSSLSSLYPVVGTMCFSNWSFDIDTVNFSPDINLIRFGASILRDAFIAKEVVRKEIFTYILDRISTAQSMSIALPSIIILRYLIINYSHLFDRNKLNAINESLCDFMTLPTDVSIAYMFAIIPLIHRHQHFTNDILLTLKKSMAHPSQNARITTVIASLMLIDAVMTTGADDDNIMLSQTRARDKRMSMTMNSQSQYQLCEEIIGYIRRALTQDVLVRSALYSAIIDIYSKHTTIRSLIINELILPHLTEYHKPATARMPVDLSKCLDTDANVLEPLHHLLQCAFQCIRITLTSNNSRVREAERGGDEEDNNDNINMIQPLRNIFDDITQRFCHYHIQDLQLNRPVESITPAERMRYEMLHGVLQVILDYSMKDHHINNNTNIQDNNNNVDLLSGWKMFQDIFQIFYTLHIWLTGEKIITDKDKTANKRTKKKRKIDSADAGEDHHSGDEGAAGEYNENDDMMIEEEGRRPWTTPNTKGKPKSSNISTKKKKPDEERFKLKKSNTENNNNNNKNKNRKTNNTKEALKKDLNNNKSQSLSLFKLSHILSIECLNILYQSFATKQGEIYETINDSIALQRFMAHTLLETIERFALFDVELYYHLDPTISYTTYIIKYIGKILLRHFIHSFHLFKESGEAPYCTKKYHSLMLMHLETLNITVVSTIRHGGVTLLSDLTPIMLPPKLATHARQHVTDNPSFAIMELLKRVAQVCDTFMTAPAPMEAQQTLSLMNALIKLDTTDTSETNSLLRNQLTTDFDQDIMRQVVDDHNLLRHAILFFLDVSHHDLSLKHALAVANDIHTVYGQFDTLSSSKNGHKKIAPSNETDYTIINRKSASTVTVALCHYIVSVLTDISWMTRQIKQLSSLYDTAYSHRILNQRYKQLTTLRSQYESACFNRLYSLVAVLQPLTQTSFVGIEGETVLRTFSQYYKNVSNVIRVLQQAKNKRPAPSGLARLCLAINAQLTYSLHELLAYLQSPDRVATPSKASKSAQSTGTSAAQIQRELNVHPDVTHAIDVYESLLISYTESSGGTDLTKNIHRSRGRDFKIDTQSIRRSGRQNRNDGDDDGDDDEEEARQYVEEGEREEYNGGGDAHDDDAIRNENSSGEAAVADQPAEPEPSPHTLDHMVIAALGDNYDEDGERIKSE